MKKLFLIVLIMASILSMGIALADCPPSPDRRDPDTMRSGAAGAKNHGFLFKITKDKRSSYLYGTIHLARFQAMFPGSKLQEVIQKVDTVALEVDLTDPEMQQRMEKALARMQAHNILPAQRAAILNLAKTQCIPEKDLIALMPELQVLQLQLAEAKRDFLFADFAVDPMIAWYGRAGNKRILSLEQPEAQLALLRMDTPEETQTFVQQALDQLHSGQARKLIKKLYHSWLDSDMETLSQYKDWCDCMKTDLDKKFMHRLLDERNITLAKSIDAEHRSGARMLIAIGSLHLIGDQGLPALFRAMGYQVEPVAMQ